jgi:hypothetical protein
MAKEKSSAPHAHPSIEDHDDTVEAHYACLVGSLLLADIEVESSAREHPLKQPS